MRKLRAVLRIRRSYGNPDNSEISTAAEPTDTTMLAGDNYHTGGYHSNGAAADSQGNSTTANYRGNQAADEYGSESSTLPEEGCLIQSTDNTKEQASSSETQARQR